MLTCLYVKRLFIAQSPGPLSLANWVLKLATLSIWVTSFCFSNTWSQATSTDPTNNNYGNVYKYNTKCLHEWHCYYCILASVWEYMLDLIWKDHNISLKNKVIIYLTSHLSSDINGHLIKGNERRLDTFDQICLRKILRINWTMKVSSAEVRRESGTTAVISLNRSTRLCWLGHSMRMDNSWIPKWMLKWTEDAKGVVQESGGRASLLRIWRNWG